ncbi:hypothetical protein CASFOL_020974 [Castilleja foliolosa]|uniref:Anther-specific protein BCP1-like n=1 Tax=Castilleja foliolosa TaxID=1961234 RepID=A0ABD3D3Y9_9LAMI
MANQIIVIALIFMATVGIASASTAAPSLAPAAASGSGNRISEGPTGESTDTTIGTISGGNTATDAAPVGGPVPDGVFEDLAPSVGPAPANGATALGVAVVSAAAGVIGSLLL